VGFDVAPALGKAVRVVNDAVRQALGLWVWEGVVEPHDRQSAPVWRVVR
jgi:hypothetical protein